MELLKRIDVDDEYLRMESHGEPLVKATNFNAVVDTNLTKDDGNDHVHLPLRCFLDLAQQQTSVEPATKRIKMDTTRSKFIDVDFIMKHVADIVLVLSGLGLIRAGREPTLEERRLQAEAYGHLGFLLQNVNPRELISKVAIENLIEDLGLRKSKGQELKSFAQILEEFQPPAPVSMVKLLILKLL
ncbi:hypothetical protein KP509_35G059600 [Ceratopteris richardii]|uniref:DUF7797 domain-containing protein n=1 Tax=Ceratopteris richardii TaxID=49495 RepID=A0A8T2QI39_CERRI|nr:hypothetical protein KP509_35G059600 [Ceratopteris richardii]